MSIVLGRRGNSGLGVDINRVAIENSRLNAARYNIENVKFRESDLFTNGRGAFDVIVCNPPYSDHPASDAIDKMFWDEHDAMKKKFFREAGRYLKPGGHIFFGWADFADLDVDLPFRLAKEAGLRLVDIKDRPSSHKNCTFYVLEFVGAD